MARKIGDKIKIISGGFGALGSNNMTGIVISKPKKKPSHYMGEFWSEEAPLYVLIGGCLTWGLCKGHRTKLI